MESILKWKRWWNRNVVVIRLPPNSDRWWLTHSLSLCLSLKRQKQNNDWQVRLKRQPFSSAVRTRLEKIFWSSSFYTCERGNVPNSLCFIGSLSLSLGVSLNEGLTMFASTFKLKREWRESERRKRKESSEKDRGVKSRGARGKLRELTKETPHVR